MDSTFDGGYVTVHLYPTFPVTFWPCVTNTELSQCKADKSYIADIIDPDAEMRTSCIVSFNRTHHGTLKVQVNKGAVYAMRSKLSLTFRPYTTLRPHLFFNYSMPLQVKCPCFLLMLQILYLF